MPSYSKSCLAVNHELSEVPPFGAELLAAAVDRYGSDDPRVRQLRAVTPSIPPAPGNASARAARALIHLTYALDELHDQAPADPAISEAIATATRLGDRLRELLHSRRERRAA